jgi:hypothetical protein
MRRDRSRVCRHCDLAIVLSGTPGIWRAVGVVASTAGRLCARSYLGLHRPR